MLCRLRGVPVESVLPLRLSGGAFAVWSQLPAHSQSSLVAVRGALYAAFALDQHAAYEAFSARRLRPGESADVFLADLRRLAALFGGLPERALTCAFVAGLPDDVRQTIRAGSKAEGLDLTTIVWRPRQVRVTTISGGQLECCGVGAVVVEAPTGHRGTLETVVVEKRPLGVDMVLGIAGVSALDSVVAHFEKFGLNCKPPERAASGARLLGLRVQAEGGKLQWTRDNAVGAPPAPVTRRAVFSWCGRLVAHLPVCGWLRPAVAWLKRRVNQMTRAWDDVTDDAALRAQLDYVAGRLNGDDPARGTWCVEGDAMAVWTDASSLATGVVLESADGDVIEDACWLRHNEHYWEFAARPG
ncbi:hypothetical protein FJT64_018880 [Amphibalanus amphitrite]|uniref:DUF7047 domain-containing protein n=1 Tax=Amphibalanus amphitrite TaxID=1232801 RepID=A0A6A4X1W6_AMPAM|nr:hypothetical protein FJT64_018880 [Amphibalanus amphitrite]